MSSKSQKSGSAKRSPWVATGVALLVVAIGLILWNPRNDDASDALGDESASQSENPDRRGLRIEDGITVESEPTRSRSSKPRRDGPEDLVPGMFPLVEGILADETISESGAAASLAEIAMRSDITLEERYEALSHGMNLDFPSFVDFPKDSALPSELAQLYLDGLLNYNQGPVLQIEGCLALMKHSDGEIQSQAKEQLAFLVKDESLVDFPERLPQAAAERIKTLKELPPEPLLTDESTDGTGLE